MPKTKRTYFLSDAHLGSLVISDGREQERKLCRFLDSIKTDAEAIYFLGDMFDFWFEYRMVVPKGFTRFLGKVAELSDAGVDIHFFPGNHDMWTFGYLRQELGITVHEKPCELIIQGKNFFLAHGDGLNEKGLGVRLIQGIFRSKTCQFLFRIFPPFFGIKFGYNWSRHNREKEVATHYYGEENEWLVQYAKTYSQSHSVDYFIFGHRHILLDLMLRKRNRVIILGDWISLFSYAVFDGETLELHQYDEA